MRVRHMHLLILLFPLLPVATGAARANGFAIDEQDPVSLGTVLAGRAASADDPVTVYYNPAGMTRIAAPAAAASVVYIRTTGQFTDEGSTLSGAALTGGDGGDGGVDAAVPSLYLVSPGARHWRFGLAFNVPFGLGSKFDEGWVGRYHALESSLAVVNLNVAVARRVTDRLSLGAGLNAQHLDVELINAVDLGSLLGAPQAIDGRSTLSGTNWAFGYNFGLLYEATPAFRVGLAYRSHVRHEIDGEARFDIPAAAAPLTAAGLFRDTGANAELTLPETLSLSAYMDVSPRWAMLADVTYTGWSRIRALHVTFDNPLQAPLVEELSWHDTYRVSIGTVYRLSEEWTARFGAALDPSPSPDRFQRPRLALGDRILVGAGVSYRMGRRIELDLAYMQSFSEDVRLDLSQPATSGTLRGTFDLAADLFALRLLVRF